MPLFSWCRNLMISSFLLGSDHKGPFPAPEFGDQAELSSEQGGFGFGNMERTNCRKSSWVSVSSSFTAWDREALLEVRQKRPGVWTWLSTELPCDSGQAAEIICTLVPPFENAPTVGTPAALATVNLFMNLQSAGCFLVTVIFCSHLWSACNVPGALLGTLCLWLPVTYEVAAFLLFGMKEVRLGESMAELRIESSIVSSVSNHTSCYGLVFCQCLQILT